MVNEDDIMAYFDEITGALNQISELEGDIREFLNEVFAKKREDMSDEALCTEAT